MKFSSSSDRVASAVKASYFLRFKAANRRIAAGAKGVPMSSAQTSPEFVY
jgi:hypothetical protein